MTELLPVQTLDVEANDGHRWQLQVVIPEQPQARLLWLPAMGVAARHYLPFAQELASRGVAVFVHDWRGNGSSDLRAAPDADWGYRELLTVDLPATEAAIDGRLDGLPRIIGGHSLGGQLGVCRLALAPHSATRLWLVASGAPYWRTFPLRTRLWIPMVYRFLRGLADWRGYLPGHSIGFGGREARSLIRDWVGTALSGRYAAQGLSHDLEDAFTALEVEARALVLARDWLVPASSADYLLSKLSRARHRVEVLDGSILGTRADHFGWMKQPHAVAEALVRPTS